MITLPPQDTKSTLDELRKETSRPTLADQRLRTRLSQDVSIGNDIPTQIDGDNFGNHRKINILNSKISLNIITN